MSVRYLHMPIGQMTSIFSYGAQQSEEILHPTWEQVQEAIRRLDRDMFPSIWLYTTPVTETNDDVPQFEVTGGDGAYVVQIRSDASDYRGRILQNPSGGNEEVEVWTSDQGASFAAHNVCTHLEEVLRVTRHFFDHGEPAPHTQWR